MENTTINKLLIALLFLAIIVLGVNNFATNKVLAKAIDSANRLSESMIEASKNKSAFTDGFTNSMSENRNFILTHPYNECMKIFADQARDASGAKEFDFEKAKSACFELLHKEKDKEKGE